jgi:hypothetical protein
MNLCSSENLEMTHRRKDALIAREWGTIEKVAGGCILTFGQVFGNRSRKVMVVEVYLLRIEETGGTS